MNEEIKNFFNDICSNWNNSDDINVILELLNEVEIKENAKVLDLGCGKGIITPLLFNITKTKVIALDISDKMIDCAKAKYNDGTKYCFIADDFYSRQFNDKFDYIVLYNAYPHFLDVEAFKKKAYDALNDDGKLVIMHSLSKEQLKKHHQSIPHLSRILLEPKEEAKYYKDYFELIKSLDLDDRYLMILKKH